MKKIIISVLLLTAIACQDIENLTLQDPHSRSGIDTTFVSNTNADTLTDIIMNDYVPFALPSAPDTIPYPDNYPLEFQWLDCNQDIFNLIYPGQYNIQKFGNWKTYNYLGQSYDTIYRFYHPDDNCLLKLKDLLVYIEICKIIETQ